MELRRIVEIHDLRRQGLSVSEIARQMGLDRKTVRKYLDRGLGSRGHGCWLPMRVIWRRRFTTVRGSLGGGCFVISVHLATRVAIRR